MFGTFYIVNKHFWRTLYGPFLAFVFPAILLIILGNVMQLEYIFPGIIALSMLIIGVFILPLTLMELKKSSLFKYMGPSPINTRTFSLAILVFFFAISILALGVMFVVLMLVFKSKVFAGSEKVLELSPHWGLNPITPDYAIDNAVTLNKSILSGLGSTKEAFEFLYSIFIAIVLSLTIGILIATFARSSHIAVTVSVVIILPTMFLSGMVLSVDIISESKAMQWLSRFMIFRYTTANLIVSMTPKEQLDLFVPQYGIYDLFGRAPSDIFAKDPGAALRRLILGDQYNLIHKSTNDIFGFDSVFTVRRVPQPDLIKNYMHQYLADDKSSSDKFLNLWNKIQSDNFDWLNLFMNQNAVLYETTDKVLNVFLPIGLIAGSGFVIKRNFKWSIK